MFRLLVVEDEEILRNWLKESMDWTSLGFELVATAENGIEALNIIESTQIDAVLTDINMPDMDGIELMKMLNTNHPEIRIVILSGYNSFEYARKAIQYGAFEFLTKPIAVEELINVFSELNTNIKKMKNELRSKFINENGENEKADIVQEAFLEALLTKDVEKNFILLSLEQLKIQLLEESFCIACVRFHANSECKVDKAKVLFKSISLKYFDNNNTYCLWIENFFVIIFSNRTRMSLFDYKKEISKYKYYIEENLTKIEGLEPLISIGMSSPNLKYENMGTAYKEAYGALTLAFYEGKGKIIEYSSLNLVAKNEVSRDNKTYLKIIDEVAETLTEAFFETDSKLIRLAIENYFNTIINLKLPDIAFIRIKVMELFVILDFKYKEINKNLLQLSEKQDIYMEIFKIDTIQELKYWVLKKSDQIISEVNEKSIIIDDNNVASLVRKFVFANIDKKITISDIADAIHIGQTYLCTVFKKETGITLVNYITDMKILKAKEYLEKPGIRIKDIAELLGFNDYRYFCTIFKKETGITPLEYKTQKT